MANRILKGLAVAAGTGLAMGFTTGRARVTSGSRTARLRPEPVPPTPHTPPAANPFLSDEPDDEFLNIEPLLDRLEERVDLIGQPVYSQSAASPVSEDYAAALADLDWRVEENTRELALLREQIVAAERRMTESVASVQRSIEETRAEIPVVVELHVSARIDDMRNRFAAEIEQSQQRTLEMFERAIDEKISSRIGSIERALADQAGSIEALSVRTKETDSNLQRLVMAIEKLCERAQLIAPVSEERLAQVPPYTKPWQRDSPMPFESQLDDAMHREPAVPVLRTGEPAIEVQVPSFTGSEPRAPKKSRFLFRNLIVAGFSVLASRLFR